MRKVAVSFVTVCNVPHKVCHVLLGKDHNRFYRYAVGAVVMVGGVAVMHCGPEGSHYVSTVCEVFDGFIHALGATPYLEALLASE